MTATDCDPETCNSVNLRYSRAWGAWEVPVPDYADVPVGEVRERMAEIAHQLEDRAHAFGMTVVDVAFTIPDVADGTKIALAFAEEHGHMPRRYFDPDRHYLRINAVSTTRPRDEEPANVRD